MLFDLRGRGRRRTVQTIYMGLAVLMALGLIGFGVGSGISGGGFVEGLTNKEGGATSSYAKQVEQAQRRTKKHPGEAAAWAALAEARLHEVGTGEYYDQETGRYTSKGKEALRRIVPLWERYLKLSPSKPSAALARNMAARVFSEEALNEPAQAVQALQILVAAEPTNAHVYSSLAVSAYQAKDVGVGALAAKKAVALAPKVNRPRMELEFEKLRKSATGSSSSSTTATVNPSGGSSSSSSGKSKK